MTTIAQLINSRAFQKRLLDIRRARDAKQERMLLACRTALRAPKINYSHIGREVAISPSTLMKFAFSETASPQFKTVLAIIEAMQKLGYVVNIETSGTNTVPINLNPECLKNRATIHRIKGKPKYRKA